MNRYKEYLLSFVDYSMRDCEYSKLFNLLHETYYEPHNEQDENRVQDGIDIRYRYFLDTEYTVSSLSDNECTILELLIGIIFQAEEMLDTVDNENGEVRRIMLDHILENMGLKNEYDDNFDHMLVVKIINRFNDSDYKYNGFGGPFVLANPERAVPTMDLYYQLCKYINERGDELMC